MILEQFKNQTALVIGGSGGIGAAIAQKLANAGAGVCVHYFSSDAIAKSIVTEINGNGGKAMCISGDIGDPTQCQNIVNHVCEELGGLDMLINSAGTVSRLPLSEVSPDEVNSQINTNLTGVIFIIQAALQRMKQGARIINISSNLAYTASPNVALYSALKSAVITLTQCLSKELGHKGIRINSVAPGATMTQMLSNATEELLDFVRDSTPLGRIAEPEDIADVVLYLCSNEARWVTGRTIIADGGYA